MSDWMAYSLLAVVLWGIVGLLQKLGTNRISADSLMVWLIVGFIVLLPWLLAHARLAALGRFEILIGVLVGLTNGLGAWFLFASLASGAKASVAVPLTSLYPLVTVVLAFVFLDERLTAIQWGGVGLAIIAGVLMSYETPAQLDPKREAEPTNL